MVQTNVQTYGPAAIATAAELILSGEPVAVPTETVYGLAADASNGEAVARIYDSTLSSSMSAISIMRSKSRSSRRRPSISPPASGPDR